MVLEKETGMNRKLTKKVKVGDIGMGGDWPISLQSMTNTDTRDAQATIRQIIQLQEAGCDLVRIAVFDKDCVSNIKKIKAA